MDRIIIVILLLVFGTLAAAAQVAPLPPPPPPAEQNIINEQVTPPAEPETYEAQAAQEQLGLFGLGQDADFSCFYLNNRTGLFGLIGFQLDRKFKDPWRLGALAGLAEDALELKLGSGFFLGGDDNQAGIFSIPLFAEAAVYFNEKSFFGHDPFFGLGINLNLFGSDSQVGGLGSQIYLGLLVNFDPPLGDIAIKLSYNQFRVANSRTAGGLSLAWAKDLIL